MYRKRRFKRKYNWFPPIGTEVGNEDFFVAVAGREFRAMAVGPHTGTGGVLPINTAVTPFISDNPSQIEEFDPNARGALAGAMGQDAFVKRIVGKAFIGLEQRQNVGGDQSNPIAALVSLGIFIARAEDADVDPTMFLPIGAQTAQQLRDNYSAAVAENLREPWVWRREWILGNQAQKTEEVGAVGANQALQFNQVGLATFPRNTAEYGSVLDGPHVDAQTARRITSDERLYLSLSVAPWPPQIPAQQAISIDGYISLRVLGQLRKAKNRSAF